MKNSRGRRTSDKLAVYRAATVKRAARQTGVQGPTRVSPRKKSLAGKKDSGNGQSPTGSHRASVTAAHGTPRGAETGKRAVQSSPKTNGSPAHCNLNDIENLEIIPETPPRPPRSQRKRTAPDSHIERDETCESNDESEKPSKKRKTFTTSPRSNGRSAVKKNGIHSSGRDLTLSEKIIQERASSSLSTGELVTDDASGSDEDVGFHGTYKHSNPEVIIGKGTGGKSNRRDDGDTSSPFSGCKGLVSYLEGDLRAGTAERSAVGDEFLDVLKISSATMSRLMEGFGDKLISELAQMQRDTVSEMKKISDIINESVSSEMRHFEGILSMLSRNINVARGTRNSGKTSLSEWEAKLNALTADTDIIFNKEIFGWLLAYNSPNTAHWIFQNHGDNDIERASMSAQTLLFSLQPGDKKFSYSGKVGTLHSDFKFNVIRNAFYNMQWDSFELFQKPMAEGGSDQNVLAERRADRYTSMKNSSLSHGSFGSPSKSLESYYTHGSRKIKRPTWLENKVTLDHINEARNFLERPNQSRKKKIRQTPSPFDIVCHGALRVYRLLGNYLHVRRGAVRSSFFQTLGYLLVPWSRMCADVSQQTLDMKWLVDGDVTVPIDDVPCTGKCAFVSGPDVVTSVDAKNNGLLRSLFSDWPQFVLSVEHTVYVVKGGSAQRKHTGGEATTIRRLFNVIDVACDFCVEFCGARTRETFFRAHKYALRCVMIFATLFKAFVTEFMSHRNEYCRRAAGNRKDCGEEFPDPLDLEVYGLSLKEIIPGPSAQKNLLESRCLRMTQTEYETYNHVTENGGDGTQNDGEPVERNEMVDIEESEEMGIEMI